MAPSDAVLVERVRTGDRDAYGALVRRHQDGLYRHARGMGLDHDTTLDLVQDTFVRAYTGLPFCRDPDRFGLWAFRILRNACLDHVKSPARRGVPLSDEVASRAPNTELLIMLDDAFASLTPELREAFLLKHRDGRSYQEMAEITGAGISALKMRVHRAREELRRLLEGPSAQVTAATHRSSV